jgi:hypothetical protein
MRLAFSLITLLLLTPISSMTEAKEQHLLEYEVTYTGSMSSNKPMKVSKAVWSGPRLKDRSTSEISLRISSEKHTKVELMLPFRYCHKSKYDPRKRHAMGFETFQRAGPKVRFFVAGFDWKGGVMHRLLSTAQLPSNFDPFALFGSDKKGSKLKWKTQRKDADLYEGLLDRLTMLQHVRTMKLRNNQVISMPVSNGRDVLEYWVTVSRQKNLKVAGKRWDSYKLTFETFDLDPDKDKPPHPPISVWISRDNERIPLRLYVKHPAGTFDATLVRASKTSQKGPNCKNWSGFEKK